MAILLVNKCYIFRRKKTEISVLTIVCPMNPLPPIFIHSIRVRILASSFPSVLTSTGMDKKFTECFSSCGLVHISKVYGCVIEKKGLFMLYFFFHQYLFHIRTHFDEMFTDDVTWSILSGFELYYYVIEKRSFKSNFIFHQCSSN